MAEIRVDEASQVSICVYSSFGRAVRFRINVVESSVASLWEWGGKNLEGVYEFDQYRREWSKPIISCWLMPVYRLCFTVMIISLPSKNWMASCTKRCAAQPFSRWEYSQCIGVWLLDGRVPTELGLCTCTC